MNGCPLQGQEDINGDGQCDCNTAMGYFEDITSTNCVMDCPSTQALDLTLMKCMSVAGGNGDCGANAVIDTVPTPDRCVCAVTGGPFFIAANGMSCVSACNATLGELLNFAGTRCITGCPANSAPTTVAPIRCACSTGFFLDLAGTSCINACPAGQFLNLQRTQCISVCPGNQIHNTNPNECRCDQSSPGSIFFMNLIGDMCVQQCTPGQ